MIISISGHAGAGKDLVGKIIQYYIFMDIPMKNRYYPTDEFIREYLLNTNINLNKESGYNIKKFAAKVKEVCSIITGIPIERFDDHDFKESILGDNWDIYEYVTGFVKDIDGNSLMNWVKCSKEKYEYEYRINWQTARTYKRSVRGLLQRIGTEVMRNQIHPNVWINALFVDYKSTYENNPWYADKSVYDVSEEDELQHEPMLPNWIITDTRFSNEIEIIKKHSGICIKVVRDNGTRAIDLHPSECELDNYTFDYVLDNDSDINSLMVKVRTLLQTLKLIK